MSDIFTFQISDKAPDFKDTKIKLYEIFIRQELVDPVLAKYRREIEDMAKPIDEKMMERFRFDKLDGLRFLLSSLDILGDSEAAITEFNKTKIEIGTRINYSEMYLRIYGVLSAVYIHSQSLDTLCELFKVVDAKEIAKELDNSGIMYLRHIIAAHPLNFSTEFKTKESFQLVRMSLTNGGNLQVRNHQGEFKHFNIFELLKSYELLAQTALHQLSMKIISNLYQTSADKISDLRDKLNKIRM